MLIQTQLGDDSIQYIIEQLSLGGVLSNFLKEANIKSGYVHTYYPRNFLYKENMDYSESIEFLHGQNVTQEFHKLMEKEILKSISHNTGNVAIFETLWNGSDPIASKRQLQYFTINDRKYDYVTEANRRQNMHKYLLDAIGYPTVISVSNLGKSISLLKNKDEIDKKIIDLIIKGIEKIIIGAFDGEGFLIWTKDMI